MESNAAYWLWSFSFLNILKTKCNRVQERAFFFTLSCTLSCAVFKISKKKKLHTHQKCFRNNLRFFTNECTHLFKKSRFVPQGPQMQRNSSVTLHVSPKNPISAEKNYFFKNPNFAPKFFSSVVWSKKNWSYTFSKWISWQFSSNWLFQRNVDSDLERAQTSEHCYNKFHLYNFKIIFLLDFSFCPLNLIW